MFNESDKVKRLVDRLVNPFVKLFPPIANCWIPVLRTLVPLLRVENPFIKVLLLASRVCAPLAIVDTAPV